MQNFQALSGHTLMCSPAQKLSEPHYLGVITKVLLSGHILLNHWPLVVENPNLFITWLIPQATSFHLEVSRGPPRVTLLE